MFSNPTKDILYFHKLTCAKLGIGIAKTVMMSYLHIAKGECQCVNSSVDLSKKLLFVLFVHLLKVHTCKICKVELSQASVANINYAC